MKLAQVHVRNFRCLEDVAIDLIDLTVLLGPNSAGKSSLLHALAFFFEGVELDAADVFGGGDKTVSVECVFEDINKHDREALGPYAAGKSGRT
jgi:putative ATP-dependent endonuclease of the OLD family